MATQAAVLLVAGRVSLPMVEVAAATTLVRTKTMKAECVKEMASS